MDAWKKFQQEREEAERKEREDKQRRIREEIARTNAVAAGRGAAEEALQREKDALAMPVIESSGVRPVIKTASVEGAAGAEKKGMSSSFVRTSSRSTPAAAAGDADVSHEEQKKILDSDIQSLAAGGAVKRAKEAALAAIQAEQASARPAVAAKIAEVAPGEPAAAPPPALPPPPEAPAAAQVTLAGCPVAEVVSASESEIVVVAGPGAGAGAGAGDVSVKCKGRAVAVKKAAFRYRPAPSVSGVEPAEGPLAGGEEVRVAGANLCDAGDPGDLERVELCGVPLAALAPAPDGSLVGKLGACPGAPGRGDVVVVSRKFGTARLAGGFAYLPRGRVAAVEPAAGPLAGGTRVSVAGVRAAAVFVAREAEVVFEVPDLSSLAPGKADVALRSRRFGETVAKQAFTTHRPGEVREVAPQVGPLGAAARCTCAASASAPPPPRAPPASPPPGATWRGRRRRRLADARQGAPRPAALAAPPLTGRGRGQAVLAGAFTYAAASHGAAALAATRAEHEAELEAARQQRKSDALGDLPSRRIVTERREELMSRVRALLGKAPVGEAERAECAAAAHELLMQELDAVRSSRSGRSSEFRKFQEEREKAAASERQRLSSGLYDDLAARKAVSTGKEVASERMAAARARADRILPTRRLRLGAEPEAPAAPERAGRAGRGPPGPDERRRAQLLFAEKVAAMRRAKEAALAARIDSPPPATLEEAVAGAAEPVAGPGALPVPDPRCSYLDGPGATCGTAAAVTLYLRDASRRHLWSGARGGAAVEARVRGPQGHQLPAVVHDNRDGSYAISFRPREEDLPAAAPAASARYEVEVTLGGRPVGNSPLPVLVTRPALGAAGTIEDVVQSDLGYSEEEMAACRRFDGVEYAEGGLALDLALVLDCTNSMQPYIDEMKRTLAEVGRLVRELSPLLGKGPDALRVALVAYRDHPEPGRPPEAGAWLVKTRPLGADLDGLAAELDGLQEAGGDDRRAPPEACEDALAALARLEWRPAAARLAVLVSDAPGHGAMLPDALKWDRYPQGGPTGLAWEVECERLRRAGIALCSVDCSYDNGLAYLEYVEKQGRAHFAAQDTGEASGAELDDAWRRSVRAYYTSIMLFLRAAAETTGGAWLPVAGGAPHQVSAALYAHAEAALDRARFEALVAARAVDLREARAPAPTPPPRLTPPPQALLRLPSEGPIRVLRFAPVEEADVEAAVSALLARCRAIERAPTRRAALDRLAAAGGALLAVADAFEP
eukprot:tig00000718_g3749.t1